MDILTTMTQDITIVDEQHLPSNLPDDPYHPGNQGYMQNLKGLQQMIVTASINMIPWHVTAVKALAQGSLVKDVAVQVDKSVNAVSQLKRRKDVKELRALLIHYNQAIAGPDIAQKKRILWEMAVDFKDVEPNVTIKSIAELNKIDGVYDTAKKDTAINIVINNEILPKGKLDQ